MSENLEQQIESVLFWKAEPMKFSQLTDIFGVKTSEVEEAIESLKTNLQNRGVSIVTNEKMISLVTAPASSEIIEKLQKEELTKDLSKAALETLSIILYRGPIKRSEIDYIRGVNSQFTLRALLIRGLIEKKTDANDERAYVYSTSLDTLAHMGVSKIEDLPEFESVNSDIEKFMAATEETGETEENESENVTEN
jgi:segregation and condensation protein B